MQMALGWLMFLLVGITFTPRAVLNEQRRYLSGAITPFLRAAAFVVIMLLLLWFGTSSSQPMLASWVLISAALLSSLPVIVVHWIAYARRDKKHNELSQKRAKNYSFVWKIWWMLTVVLGYQILVSGGRLIDRAFASFLETGTVAAVEYSYSLTSAVAALATSAASIVLVPELRRVGFFAERRPSRPFLLLAVLIIVCGIAGIISSAFSELLISWVYGRGAFDASAIDTTAKVFQWQSISLLAVAIGLITSQFLIASGKTSALMWLALLKLIIKAAMVALTLKPMGVASLGVSYAISEAVFAMLASYVVIRGTRNGTL